MNGSTKRSLGVSALLLLAVASRASGQNFVVYCADQEFAEEVRQKAESLRSSLSRDWHGDEMPKWSRSCPITVTVGPNVPAGGSTYFVFEQGEVFGWKMQIQGTRERILDSVLPHEITHAVFASHFRRWLPRWLDEGGSSSIEHVSELARMDRDLLRYLRTGRGIPFSTMIGAMEYPRDIHPFYAQSASASRFLIHHQGQRAFTDLIHTGLRTGNWPSAINERYGFDSLSDFQDTWLSWVRSGSPSPQRVANYVGGQTVLLDFTATWCGPCQRMAPVVESLIKEGHHIRRIDADRDSAETKHYGVNSWPTLIMLVDGVEVSRVSGIQSREQLLAMLAKGGQPSARTVAQPQCDQGGTCSGYVWNGRSWEPVQNGGSTGSVPPRGQPKDSPGRPPGSSITPPRQDGKFAGEDEDEGYEEEGEGGEEQEEEQATETEEQTAPPKPNTSVLPGPGDDNSPAGTAPNQGGVAAPPVAPEGNHPDTVTGSYPNPRGPASGSNTTPPVSRCDSSADASTPSAGQAATRRASVISAAAGGWSLSSVLLTGGGSLLAGWLLPKALRFARNKIGGMATSSASAVASVASSAVSTTSDLATSIASAIASRFESRFQAIESRFGGPDATAQETNRTAAETVYVPVGTEKTENRYVVTPAVDDEGECYREAIRKLLPMYPVAQHFVVAMEAAKKQIQHGRSIQRPGWKSD